MRLLFVVAAALALATAPPAAAVQIPNGFEITENFEALPLGAASFDFVSGYLGTLSGGAIITATPEFPALSGTQVYAGTTLIFNIVNKVDFDWPAIGATISGAAPVAMTVYGFDYNLFSEIEVVTLTTLGGVNESLFYLAQTYNYGVSRAVFTSSQAFAIDDFIVGLPNVSPGIPEPASWLTLLLGFALTGAALRRCHGQAAPLLLSTKGN
ncbi:MAG: hypothetical protein CFE37_10055 [Alphaproteobacteria bacterium PA4]|nr:MAG: hypothetical protein CFE37_10055 [Alphaproteobacteria bacterium PA4]